jgi:hypothetical protein
MVAIQTPAEDSGSLPFTWSFRQANISRKDDDLACTKYMILIHGSVELDDSPCNYLLRLPHDNGSFRGENGFDSRTFRWEEIDCIALSLEQCAFRFFAGDVIEPYDRLRWRTRRNRCERGRGNVRSFHLLRPRQNAADGPSRYGGKQNYKESPPKGDRTDVRFVAPDDRHCREGQLYVPRCLR